MFRFHAARSLFLGLLLFVATTAARSQLIDDVEWRREGNDAVLQITFAVPIQFQRATVARSGDLVQVFYELRPRGDLPATLNADRRVAPSDGLPGVSISDDPATGLLSRKLVIRFDRRVAVRVRAGRGNCCIDVVVAGAGAAVEARAPAAPAPAAEDRFLITLQQSNDPSLRMEMPVPGELQAYQLFTTRRVVAGRTVYEINLGYFATRADAERALRVLAPRFPQAKVVELTAQPPPAAVAAVRPPEAAPPAAAPPVPTPVPAPPPVPVVPVVPVAPPAPAPAPAPAPEPAKPEVAPPAAAAPAPEAVPATSAEIDQRGRELLARARAAMDKNDLDQAVGLFNQLLNLPPNTASQDGQELIGVARARLGDVARARAEFELYLKLYPTGPGADRVRRELEKLATAGAPAERRVRRPAAPVTTFAGSFSQYYFGGRSQITQLREGTPLQGVPIPPTQDPISTVDQRQLQTSLDLNYRHRDADSDLRLVFRNVYTKNFLDRASTFSTRSPNRLNAAYVEYRALPTGFTGRLGRQSPTGDGVLYRFDGARLGYQFVPKFGVNAVAGVPADALYDAKRRFYGFSLDAENLFDHVSASLYGIQQTIDGETDRRAVGTELRYFDPQTSVFGVYDFDTLFHAVNIASLQGTWQTLNNTTTFTFLADRRTAPILTTGNALLVPESSGNIRRSVTEYLQTLTIDEVRRLAKASTTYVNQEQLGVTVQASQNFQVGANASRTNIGALPAFDPDPGRIPSIPAQPATGNIYGYSLQFISSNLYSERDSHVLSASLLKGASYKGRLFAYNNLSLIAQSLQLEPSVKYYRQDNTDGTEITRWTPALRLSWRVTRRFSIEGDVDYEMSKTRQPVDPTTGLTPVEKANRVFYFVGYRFDF
jgi:outer membrane biosynthesis protein TonB